MESFKINLTDIPRKMYDSITKDLSFYLAGLLAVRNTRQGEDVKLIGSGTFVRYGDVLGILTAQHVSKELAHSDLGLIISEVEHKFIIERKHLNFIEIGDNLSSEGPDISFIHIPANLLGTIKSKKSFYDLESPEKLTSKYEISNDFGIWFICGFPDEFTKYNEKSARGFDEAMGFFGLCAAVGGIERESSQNEYDYYEFSVGCGTGANIPNNYGGVSGGGVWQVPLLQNSQRILSWGEPILSGVAFYQSAIVGGMRKIKCHGKHSILNKLLKEMKRIS